MTNNKKQKKLVTFRFTEENIERLQELSAELELNNTVVLEQLIKKAHEKLFNK